MAAPDAPVNPAPVVVAAKSAAPAPAPARWVDDCLERTRASIVSAPPASPAAYTHAGLTTLGSYVTAGVTGSLLGAAHATWGLDTGAGAIDGWIAAGAGLLSVVLSGHMPALAAHARAVGSQGFAVLAFRKGYEVVKHEPLMGGTAVQRMSVPGNGAGVTKEDPIEIAARGLEGM